MLNESIDLLARMSAVANGRRVQCHPATIRSSSVVGGDVVVARTMQLGHLIDARRLLWSTPV